MRNWVEFTLFKKGDVHKEINVVAKYYVDGELRAGPNRPNAVEHGLLQIGKQSFVKGTMSHSGREHKEIVLKNWHLAVPNTAIGSFTIEGDVD